MFERLSLRPPARLGVLPAIALLLAASAGGCGDAPAAAQGGAGTGATAGGPAPELVAEQGSVEPRRLLTGELRAVRADEIVVPRSPTWQMQIRWMEETGTRVRRGQKLLELENEQFARELEEKRVAAAQQAEELVRLRAEAELAIADKEFAVRQRRADAAKAELEASVPESLLSARAHQERQLALERARVELAKAEQELAAARRTGRADVEVAEISLAGARREIAIAERALDALSLEAPSDGILVVEDHPWEGRPLQAGDTVWVGLTVMRIPDLSSLAVEAELPDVDDGEVQPGMEARCTVDAYPDQVQPCRVTEVGPVARAAGSSSQRRFFPVQVALGEVDPERMRPGMSVKVEVLAPPVEDGLLVPRAALDLGSDPARVRLAGGGWRRVRIAGCDAQRCAVVPAEGEALAPGERLARAGGEPEAAAG